MKHKWYPRSAKTFLIRLANEFIADPMGGLYAEAGELLAEARHGTAYRTEEGFRKIIKRICWWSDEDIEKAVQKLMS